MPCTCKTVRFSTIFMHIFTLPQRNTRSETTCKWWTVPPLDGLYISRIRKPDWGLLCMGCQHGKAWSYLSVALFIFLLLRFTAWSLFTDWWKHKTQNSWILPALIKSCSKMNPEDWDRTPATTNLGEAQHHWTNINTALKTLLLEAVLL